MADPYIALQVVMMPRDANPNVGMAMLPGGGQFPLYHTIFGGILLFVAFHNVPAGVTTFPEFLGFLTDSIKIGSAKATDPAALPGTSQAPGTVTAGGRGA